MPPRKKLKSTSASAKRSKTEAATAANQQAPQPAKFGIQHFFERHTQNALSASQSRSLRPKDSVPTDMNPTSSASAHPEYVSVTASNPSSSSLENCKSSMADPSGKGYSMPQNPENGSDSRPIASKDPPGDMPPPVLASVDLNAGENPAEESPEISRSAKHFKFSPGMLIKQSQDDGGEEIIWKISPMNERLRAAAKQMPKMMKLSADSSNPKSSSIGRCSTNKNLCASPDTASKVDKWLSSPTEKASERSYVPTNKVCVKGVNPSPDIDSNLGNINTNDSKASGNSPFQTPPSLSVSHDRFPNAYSFMHESGPTGTGQHKKTLLELLDQVEDVISVDVSATNSMKSPSSSIQDFAKLIPTVIDKAAEGVAVDEPQKVFGPESNCYFLVLEVSEKLGSADSSGVQSPYKVLRLLNEHSGEERAVYLWGEWFYSKVSPGDTVNVIGDFDEEGKCNVDHGNNFLVIHPDLLISGTRVAASFSCSRRTVLDERLKSNEHSTAALLGTLLHQLLQAGLVKDIPTAAFLEEHARIVIQKNIESLYACGVNESEVITTLMDAIPRMLNWISSFRDSKDVDFGSNNDLERVQISEVIDIEEMSWAPKYGLKGMIDASIRVAVRQNKNGTKEKIMPLEFKTGKMAAGQSSMEHRAQVILYTLLMSERYLKNIDSGLLYYLQPDHTQGIMVQRSDLVGLIMRRNELAHDIRIVFTTQQLPPMLRNPSMCRGCRHLDVCTIYHKAHGGSGETSGFGDAFDTHVSHLSTAHFTFLEHWDRLIDLEAREMQLVKNEAWRPHNRKTDPSSSCLSSMVLDMLDGRPHQSSLKENILVYRFVRQDFPAPNGDTSSIQTHPTNDLSSSLRCGDSVIVSSESRYLIVASGVITDIGRFHISVSFSKRLRLPWSTSSCNEQELLREVWRIDKDEFMSSFSVMRSNMMQLFQQSASSAQLRKMIVDLEAPRFDSGCIFSQDPAILYIWSERSLNDDQRQAILKILTAKDYTLILGMPGTGKTSTMVHAVKALLMRGSSILLTSYTNSAVDNLLIKLKAQGIDFLRIGRHEATHEDIREHCFSAMNVRAVDDIKTKLDQTKVVGVTCLGINSPLLVNKRFDVCIMDEAGQITLPVSLGPLMFASMFVLVGDHYQLPPLVQSTEARETGMGVSLFCRLSEAHPQTISPLRSQYRMCQGIMELSNALIYDNRLCCGSSQVANAKLDISIFKSLSSWQREVLDPSRPVIFINTDMLHAIEARDQRTVSNPVEAHIISEIAMQLVSYGVEGKDIGIITPYNSQANLIRNAVWTTSVETHTIDKYQGRDKDCILVSFVRSFERPRSCASSLLGDWHRINVALTRAKKKLIMVGSHNTLSKVPLLSILLKKVDEQSGIVTLSRKDIQLKGDLRKCSHQATDGLI